MGSRGQWQTPLGVVESRGLAEAMQGCIMMSPSFDFGNNWQEFSAARLDAGRLCEAVQSLPGLIGPVGLAGKSFLDIGCGSGLFSIAAAQCGASRVVGFDVNPRAVVVSQRNLDHFAEHLGSASLPHFCVGSILDRDFLGKLGTFDVVYAWGVLHHTGSMWQAIKNAASLVEPESGILAIAIYNSHWTSPVWKQVKRLYNYLPSTLQRFVCYIFAGVIFFAKLVVTRSNPLRKRRGMDFWYDVVDWIGGYPYEYAKPREVIDEVESLGFSTRKVVLPKVPTACNEFVFQVVPL